MNLRAAISACLVATFVASTAAAMPTTGTRADNAAAREKTARDSAINHAQITYGGKWRTVGRPEKVDGDQHIHFAVERSGRLPRWFAKVSRTTIPVNPRSGSVDVAAADANEKTGVALKAAQSKTARQVAAWVVPAVGALAAKQGLHLPTEEIIGALGGGAGMHLTYAIGKGRERRVGEARESTLRETAAKKIVAAEDEAPSPKRQNYKRQDREKYVANRLANAVTVKHGKPDTE